MFYLEIEMDHFDIFLGAMLSLIVASVLSIAYCLGADRVYQQCRDNGAYYVDSKKLLTCEAVK